MNADLEIKPSKGLEPWKARTLLLLAWMQGDVLVNFHKSPSALADHLEEMAEELRQIDRDLQLGQI